MFQFYRTLRPRALGFSYVRGVQPDFGNPNHISIDLWWFGMAWYWGGKRGK